MPTVFISYRRTDTSSGYASWIYERLASRFGADRVFMDVDSLPLGVDFVEHVQHAISEADITLVLIGPHWLDAVDETGARRLDDPQDFVRLEVAAALRSSVRVIPVLVDGARMPRQNELPPDLESLTRRQALVFQRHGGTAIQDLIAAAEREAIDGVVTPSGGRQEADTESADLGGQAGPTNTAQSPAVFDPANALYELHRPSSAASSAHETAGAAAPAQAQSSQWSAKLIDNREYAGWTVVVQLSSESHLLRWRAAHIFRWSFEIDGEEMLKRRLPSRKDLKGMTFQLSDGHLSRTLRFSGTWIGDVFDTDGNINLSGRPDLGVNVNDLLLLTFHPLC